LKRSWLYGNIHVEQLQARNVDIDGKPPTGKRPLWQEGQAGLSKASFNDPSNFATIAVQKARAQ
jgi:hypothetical protein